MFRASKTMLNKLLGHVCRHPMKELLSTGGDNIFHFASHITSQPSITWKKLSIKQKKSSSQSLCGKKTLTIISDLALYVLGETILARDAETCLQPEQTMLFYMKS